MDLTDFGRALRRFWPLSLVVFAVTLIAGTMIATAGEATYTATATIAITPNPAEAGSLDRAEFEIPIIVEAVGSRSFRVGLAAEAMRDVEDIEAARDLESSIVRITASGADPDAVAEAANAAVAALVDAYPPTDSDPLTPPTTGDLVVIETIDPAVPASGSGRPNFVPIMIATAVLGVILAGAAAMIAQAISRARDLEGRIRAELGVPVVAVIPPTKELHDPDAQLHTLLTSGPPALIEAFQGLRSRVEGVLGAADPTLAVSSLQRREGRTTITAGLGLMLAAVGRDCVVIDSNLRKPGLHLRLGESGDMGMSEFGVLSAGALVQPTKYPNLALVPAGSPQAHPAEVVAVALPATLEQVREQSPRTVVLIDAPPLGSALKGAAQRPPETSTVLRVAHRMLLVVDESHAHLTELAAGLDRLDAEGVVVVGVVINRRRRAPFRRSSHRHRHTRTASGENVGALPPVPEDSGQPGALTTTSHP